MRAWLRSITWDDVAVTALLILILAGIVKFYIIEGMP
jgi:hypothetical protein